MQSIPTHQKKQKNKEENQNEEIQNPVSNPCGAYDRGAVSRLRRRRKRYAKLGAAAGKLCKLREPFSQRSAAAGEIVA